MTKRCGYIVAFLLVFHTALPQDLQIKTYSTSDGLPSSYIFTIYQDKLGYLWMGTPDGLSRFDGKHFTNYGLNEGLPDLLTDGLFMDSNFHLWVGTRRGIALLKGDKFTIYPVIDSLKPHYVGHFIKTRDGRILAMTDTGIYEFASDKWIKKNLYPGYENRFCQLLETADGWYLNYGKLLVLRRPDGSYKKIGSYHDERYYNKIQMSDGEIFISTTEGIYAIENKELVKVPGPLSQLSGLYVFYRDRKKRFWVAGEKSGLQLIPHKDSSQVITVYKRSQINLFSGITEDKDANIWVADYFGLVKISEPGYKIYSLDQLKETSIIRTVLNTPHGDLLFNDGSLLLHKYEHNTFMPEPLYLKGNTALPNNELIIDRYAFDDKQRNWYVLRGFGLAMQEGNSVYEQTGKFGTLGKEAFDVLFDNYRKKILIAILPQPFPCIFNDTSYQIMPVANKITVKGHIVRLHQCANGNVLFGTSEGIIYSIDKKNVCKQQLNEFNSNARIIKFYNDPSGDLWILYGGRGLRRYTWQNDTLLFKEQIDKTNGLSNDNVVNMCFDNSANLWIASNSDITILAKSVADRQPRQVINFFDAGDLQLEGTYPMDMTKDSTGNIWMTHNRQAICFYPAKILRHQLSIPSIQIEQVNLNLRKTDWSAFTDSLSGIFQLPVNLRLPYHKNTLGIYFNGISSSGTAGVQYSYKLEPLDTSWSPSSTNNFVSFIKLPPGKYSFSVKAQLNNAAWNEPAVFSFEIKKPFWETWWFRLMVIAAASALIILIFRYRLKQWRTKTEMETQMRVLEMKALKAQMNPHFIHNALNSIQSLILNNRSSEASHYISKFAKLLRQVLENADNNLISLDRELYSLQLYVDLEKLRMNMDIAYIEEIDETILLSAIKIPPLILQPFVENALWHGLSHKQGDKRIVVAITAEDNWVICRITDNGIGRKKASELYKVFPEGHLSKAIHITRERLADLNQSPGIEPVTFVDLEKDDQPAGTTVIIRIKA